MAKAKKKLPADRIDVAIRLPAPVLKFYLELAKMTGLTASDCINVALCADLLRYRNARQAGTQHE